MTATSLKKIIKSSFTELLEKPGFDPSLFENFFSREYIQYVDGKILDYTGLLEHAKTLKSRVKDIKVSYEHLIEEGNKVCSVHIVEAIRDNQPVKMKIIALFAFENDKIILCDELTYMLLGDESDRDLGSA